jgi:hypothetical protein
MQVSASHNADVISGVPVAARRCFPDFPSLRPPGATPSDFDLQLRNRRE